MGRVEADAQAGVLGAGGTGAPGVFGRGQNGVVGYDQMTDRDPAANSFEAGEHAGVLGYGQVGVAGGSLTGAGVHGRGYTGVLGAAVNGLVGVSGDGGNGGTGVLGQGHDGPAIFGTSEGERGGIFESRLSPDQKRIRTQISLVLINSIDPANPDSRISDPTQLTKAEAGDLCVTITQDVRTNMRPIAALWFCTETSGPAGAPVWVKIA
jgi:hypothetical protein